MGKHSFGQEKGNLYYDLVLFLPALLFYLSCSRSSDAMISLASPGYLDVSPHKQTTPTYLIQKPN